MKINNALKEVLNSRMYENARGTVFNSPKEILTPLIDVLTPYVDDDNYRIKNTVGSINRNDDDSANIAYDKLIVEFELNTGGFAAEYSNMCVVFDLSGKMVLTSNQQTGNTTITIPNQTGVYILQIQSDGNQYGFKIQI